MRLLVVASAVVVLLSEQVAVAQQTEVKLACADAHEQGQLLRNAGKLLSGRDQFVACAREECPTLVRRECTELLARVELDIPTILVDARDPDGRDTADARVFVDGRILRDHLEGMALSIDPGEHLLRFEKDGVPPIEQHVVLQTGEKGRHIAVAFRMAPPLLPAMPPHVAERTTLLEVHKSPSRFAYVLTGVAMATIGSFTYFAIAGKTLERGRASSCSPNCTDDEVAPVHRDYLVADVSLGAAILATGGAIWLFTHPSRTPSPRAKWILPSPVMGGAVLDVGGAF